MNSPLSSDLQELRRLAELDPVHRLEVGRQHLPAEEREGPRIGLVGLAQRLVGDGREDLGEVRGRVQRARGHLVAGEAAGAGARGLKAFAGEFHQRHAAVLAGGVLQREQRRAVAVQERVRDRLAPRDRGVAPAKRDRDMGEGPRLVRLRRDLVEDQPTRLVDGDAALDQVVGEATLEMELVGQPVDRGDALALLRAGFADQRVGVDAAGAILGRRVGRGLGRLGLRVGGAGLRFGSAGLVVGHARLLGHCGFALLLGRLGRGLGLVRHRGCSFGGGGVPAVEDAIVMFALGAEAGGGIGAHGHCGDLERGPVHRPPEFALAVGLGDLETVNLVADGDRADVPGLDIAPDVADRVALGEPDAGDALSALDPRRARHDRADHRVEIVRFVHLQEGGARVQPLEPDMLGGHAELLVMRLAKERGAPHPGAGRPDHLDAARLGVDAVRRKLRRPAERRQFDRLLHVWILVRPRRRPGSPVQSRGRPARWIARCRSW